MAKSNEVSEIEAGVSKLGEVGYAVCLGLLPLDLVVSLVVELQRREYSGELVFTKIGRAVEQPHGDNQMQAQSSYFKNHSAPERHFSAFAKRVRLAINHRLMLSSFEFEAQFLHYPRGGFYTLHIDALHGERNRVFSMVVYLNEE